MAESRQRSKECSGTFPALSPVRVPAHPCLSWLGSGVWGEEGTSGVTLSDESQRAELSQCWDVGMLLKCLLSTLLSLKRTWASVAQDVWVCSPWKGRAVLPQLVVSAGVEHILYDSIRFPFILCYAIPLCDSFFPFKSVLDKKDNQIQLRFAINSKEMNGQWLLFAWFVHDQSLVITGKINRRLVFSPQWVLWCLGKKQ